MKLFLVRHAIAEDRSSSVEESRRALTAEGRKRMQAVAEHLAGVEFGIEVLLTSPWKRARETADILVEAGVAKKAGEASFAIPTMPAAERMAALLEWLESERAKGRQAVGIVGHSPLLEEWTESLLVATQLGKIELKKGGMVGLELPAEGPLAGGAGLYCLLNPRLLLGPH